jgi:drug/metabolite transporter (DMT)-like permease
LKKYSGFIVYAKLLLTAIFWGATFIAGRIVTQQVGPFSAAFIRFAIASICLMFLTWQLEGAIPKLRKSQILPVICLGITGVFIYNVLFFLGLRTVEAGRASVIIATNPVFISLFASLLFKEKLSRLQILGICISVIGAILVILKGDLKQLVQGSLGWGELFIFGCVVCWASYSLVGKWVMQSLSPLVSVTYSVLIGCIALIFPAVAEGIISDFIHFPWVVWIGLGYLAVFGTVLGFVWYYEGVHSIGPTKAGIFINLVPISAIILGIIILKEKVTLSLFIGTVLVILGVFWVNKKS